jgi:DtxR family Mn-dependent transcriptional regulator
VHVNDLIDTTEMYLRTIFELEEEGIVPLRARIAERLHQSGPTVSQTVARMERDGLLTVEGDRHLQLSDQGRQLATAVMRKHRLAECLLVDVIGLDYADVHEEACRWEHVMSEAVERKLLTLLGNPSVSPFGNPIPGLDALRGDAAVAGQLPLGPGSLTLLSTTATAEGRPVVIRRISEQLQEEPELLRSLADQGVRRADGARRAGRRLGEPRRPPLRPGGPDVFVAREHVDVPRRASPCRSPHGCDRPRRPASRSPPAWTPGVGRRGPRTATGSPIRQAAPLRSSELTRPRARGRRTRMVYVTTVWGRPT